MNNYIKLELSNDLSRSTLTYLVWNRSWSQHARDNVILKRGGWGLQGCFCCNSYMKRPFQRCLVFVMLSALINVIYGSIFSWHEWLFHIFSCKRSPFIDVTSLSAQRIILLCDVSCLGLGWLIVIFLPPLYCRFIQSFPRGSFTPCSCCHDDFPQ